MNFTRTLLGGTAILAGFGAASFAQPAFQNSNQGPAGNYIVNNAPSSVRGTGVCVQGGFCLSTTAAKPTIACGTTSSINTNASNAGGTVTIGGLTGSCVITFASPTYATYNQCVVSNGSVGTASLSYTYSTTAITVTETGLAGTVDYVCNGY